MSIEADRQRAALHRIAADDPELAARLILMTLPGAASKIGGTMSYVLDVAGLGSASGFDLRRSRPRGPRPTAPRTTDFRLQTDARTLVDLATGTHGPLGLMMRGRLRIRGKRRKAMKLRRMSGEVSMADVVEAGGTLDPDILYRSLPYIVDPEWTSGHDFTVRYVVTGDGGGTWYVTRARWPAPRGQPGRARRGGHRQRLLRLLPAHGVGPGEPLAGDAEPAHHDRGPDPPDHAAGALDRARPGRRRRRAEARAEAAQAPGAAGEPVRRGRHRRPRPGRPRPRVRGRRPRRRRPARLPPALRALGAPELEGHRARLHGRQGAVAGHAARGAGVHDLEPRLVLRRRGARDGRPRAVPAGGAHAARSSCSSPPSSWTRRATPRSSTASAPR